jgi:hypothetical protein
MGFIAIALCLAITVISYSTAADATSVAAPAITAITALTASYFGVQAGSPGKKEADKTAAAANAQAIRCDQSTSRRRTTPSWPTPNVQRAQGKG